MSGDCPYCGGHVSASAGVPRGGALHDACLWLEDNTGESGTLPKEAAVPALCQALALPRTAVEDWVLSSLATFGYIAMVELDEGTDFIHVTDTVRELEGETT